MQAAKRELSLSATAPRSLRVRIWRFLSYACVAEQQWAEAERNLCALLEEARETFPYHRSPRDKFSAPHLDTVLVEADLARVRLKALLARCHPRRGICCKEETLRRDTDERHGASRINRPEENRRDCSRTCCFNSDPKFIEAASLLIEAQGALWILCGQNSAYSDYFASVYEVENMCLCLCVPKEGPVSPKVHEDPGGGHKARTARSLGWFLS